MEKDNEDTPCEEAPDLPTDTYRKAIEEYRVRRRALGECEIDIDVGRFLKDTPALREALSRQNRLHEAVEEARDRIQQAAVDVVRWRGMTVVDEKPEKKEGILRTIVNKILQA